ncbi:aryl-alcohol dehydrogenase-like predicted oxidoreductase [Leucobacter exalbidus]|uniref:Aryl-alcohol dehydrogenase-like predicted oxidoreductase n=1 Tax=Leucobacter exalbidus TaxID=662960 RepID=A0A940PRN8_9MICO|nr:aldo/keto reductase [Leucobacter exalbidus]MBP1326299.1 aryl-alcohol dehydrogenase-like predicted oxidoreductase [Leucobacter exalbidus]
MPHPARVRIGASALEITPLALGGNVFGWTADRETSFDVLDAFLAGGGNFIDTADGYSHWVPGNGGGESELIIGEWLAARGNRDAVVIATKVSTHPQFLGLVADNVRAAVDASLARLQTDYIDLYYAHFDDPETPLAETVAAFSALVDSGKIRAIGVSNYTAERVAEWIRIARDGGFHLPVALQPHYNLVERRFETNGLREVAEAENLAVFPYFSLAKGFLAGKYRDVSDTTAAGASPRAAGAAEYLDDRGRATLAALDAIAAAHSVPVATVSLAWLRAQSVITAPIASARTVEQLPALLASATLELSAAEVADLAAASAG